MPIFRIRIFDETNRAVARQYSHREGDDTARRHADILSTQTRNPSIVVWDEDRQVDRERPDPSPDTDKACTRRRGR